MSESERLQCGPQQLDRITLAVRPQSFASTLRKERGQVRSVEPFKYEVRNVFVLPSPGHSHVEYAHEGDVIVCQWT